VASVNFMRLSEKAHTRFSPVHRGRKSGFGKWLKSAN